MTDEQQDGAPKRKKRRGHAAAGGRVLALGLSAAASVAFAAAMANAATPASGAASVAPEPASIIVRVVMADGQTTETVLASAPVVTAAPAKVPAIAKSRAS